MFPLLTTALILVRSAEAVMKYQFLEAVMEVHIVLSSCEILTFPFWTVAAMYLKSADTQIPIQFFNPADAIAFQLAPLSTDWYK